MRLLLITTAALVTSLGFAAPARAEWLWPLHGEVITLYRNGDDPYAGGQHRGIDIAAPVGTRVTAATGGEVRFAGTAGSSGLTVSLRTADGRYDTSYLHLSSISVREGQSVSAGDALGAVGTTGSRSASPPHLHFGVREAGRRHAYRNPLDFLPPRPAPPAPEAPPPTPAPVPAPRPVAPAPFPVIEPAARRVPLGTPAPRRVPVGGRAPRSVPVGGRALERVPVGDPAPRRVPVGGRAPRAVPQGGPGRIPARAPGGVAARLPAGDPALRGVPRGAPGAVPSPRAVPGGEPAADGARRAGPLGGPVADGVARSGPQHGLSPSQGPAGHRPTPEPGAAAEGSGRTGAPGPDIGWVIACIGLLLAAAMLGLTEDGRKATRKSHARLTGLLRPLRGRG